MNPQGLGDLGVIAPIGCSVMPMSNPQFYTVMKYRYSCRWSNRVSPSLWMTSTSTVARGLRRGEYLGHPLDTFAVLAPMLWQGFSLPSQGNLTNSTLSRRILVLVRHQG
jgi:hypothetical protein